MAQFYRKLNDPTVYEDPYFAKPIADEARLRSLGGIPDWGGDAQRTNILTIPKNAEMNYESVNDYPTGMAPRTLDGLSGGQSATFERAPQNNSYSIFNNALMEMLKSYQTMGTRPAQEQALDLSTQQAQRGMEQATPGMSPGQQSAVRSASQSALTPSIQGAQDRAQTFSEQLGGFSTILDKARAFGESIQQMEQQKKSEAIGLVDKILKEGTSSDMEALLRSNPELLKMAGYKTDLFSSLIDSRKKTEAMQQQQKQEKAQQDKQLYDLNIALKQKDLNKPYYKPESPGTPTSPESNLVQGTTWGQMLGLDKATASKFDTFINGLKTKVNNGTYGTTGAREKALNDLATAYPGINKDVLGVVIYGNDKLGGIFPDGYEGDIKFSKIVNKTTAAQDLNANYATRLQQANGVFDKIENQIAAYDPVTYWAYLNAPNIVKPAEIQEQEQAQRNFLNAVLRKESGAVISPTEFEDGRKQYFPQPGDSPEVLAQKKATRQLVTDNFINMAGGAMPTNQTFSGTLSSGLKYTIEQ